TPPFFPYTTLFRSSFGDLFRRSYSIGRALRTAGIDGGASFGESVRFLAEELRYFMRQGHVHRLPKLLPYEFLRWAGFQVGRRSVAGKRSSAGRSERERAATAARSDGMARARVRSWGLPEGANHAYQAAAGRGPVRRPATKAPHA